MELSDDSMRSIVAHLAHLRAEYGEVLAEPDLIEPNGDFFPDTFAVDPAGIGALLRRMTSYAPLSDELEVELVFVEPESDGAGAGGGCGSGACSPGDGAKQMARTAGAVETETGYAVMLDVANVSEPTLLTTAIARSLGRIVLFEAGEEVAARDEGVIAELTAVACGFGVLLLNGSCVYKKACSGMRRHQGTFLEANELSLALALFVRVANKKAGAVRRHLPVTQKEAFDEALAWVDDQPKLVRTLIEHPETLADGIFELEAKKGLFSRLFAGATSRRDDAPPDSIKIRPKQRTEAELRRLAEAKALVDEALQEG